MVTFLAVYLFQKPLLKRLSAFDNMGVDRKQTILVLGLEGGSHSVFCRGSAQALPWARE